MPNTIAEPGQDGVLFKPPPDAIINKVTGDIQRAVDALGRNFDIAAVAVSDRKGGWNTAIVGKLGEAEKRWGQVEVLMWIGKSYGTNRHLDHGARLLWAKKF